MDSFVLEGWCKMKREDTIVPVVSAILSDYLEHCFEEENNWDHIWEYVQILLNELGYGSYLVEPCIREIFNRINTPAYQVSHIDKEQVNSLRQLVLPEQRTKEWFEFRQTRLTASELSYCVSQPLGSAVSKKIILQKICPESVPYISSAATSHGTLFEPIAQMIYERWNQTKLYEFGCIPHSSVDWLAASPDGITEDGIMVEIKCPYSRKPKGIPSVNYYTQIQAQLEVCDFQICDFMECEIEFYETRKKYILDTAGITQETRDTLKQNIIYNGMKREYLPKRNSGLMKGASITLEMKSSSSKSYCMDWNDMCTTSSKDWIHAHLQNTPDMIGYHVKYWVVKRVWMTRIPRNKEWFHTLLPKAKLFWDEVIRSKEEGIVIPDRKQPMMNFIEET